MRKAILAALIVMAMSVPVFADSFGFYYRSSGFGMGMEFHDYDYYDSDSPGYSDQSEIDFRAALDPYGYWDEMEDLGGMVWIPNVSLTWSPYTYGSWSYTRYGWTWVSYEPWGWIPHHYGRWFFHPYYRWVWVPGYTYAPAWVTWGNYEGYYGWAPMPPESLPFYVSFHFDSYSDYYSHNDYDTRHDFDRSHHWYGRHDGYGSSYQTWIPNEAWVMVKRDQFASSDIERVRLDRNGVNRLLSAPPSGPNNFMFKDQKEAPNLKEIEKYSAHPIREVSVDEVTKKVNGKEVKIVNPKNVLVQRENEIKPISKEFINQSKEEKKPLARPGHFEKQNNGNFNKQGKPEPLESHSGQFENSKPMNQTQQGKDDNKMNKPFSENKMEQSKPNVESHPVENNQPNVQSQHTGNNNPLGKPDPMEKPKMNETKKQDNLPPVIRPQNQLNHPPKKEAQPMEKSKPEAKPKPSFDESKAQHKDELEPGNKSNQQEQLKLGNPESKKDKEKPKSSGANLKTPDPTATPAAKKVVPKSIK
jgi:hypothetical protein